MIYVYNQNCSGGNFIENESIGRVVVIQADNLDDANHKAVSIGIYFDGVTEDLDCRCCGDRWSAVPEVFNRLEDYLESDERFYCPIYSYNEAMELTIIPSASVECNSDSDANTPHTTITNRLQQLRAIQDNAYHVFEKKNTDYGDAFAKYGTVGVLMRIQDKISRGLTITKNSITLVNDESLRDTLLDLHNYAAMAVMLMDEQGTTITETN